MENIENNNYLKHNSQLINNSLLIDEEKFFEIIKTFLNKNELQSISYLTNFNEISKETFSLMQIIDNLYQKGGISEEIAWEIFADLLAVGSICDGIRGFLAYKDEVFRRKFNELYRLFEGKYQTLIEAFLNGKISEIQFIYKLRKLITLESNTFLELYRSNEILKSKGK